MPKIFLCIVLIFLLLFMSIPESDPISHSIATEALSTQERNTQIETYSACIEPLPHEPYRTPINSFSVNNSGYALCCSGSSGKGSEILVYDLDGVYLYGFTFDPGCAFRILRRDNDVVLYLYRSYLSITVDAAGTITDVRRIQDHSENMRNLDRMQNIKSISLDRFTYEIRKDSGVQLLPGYSCNKLIRTDEDGQERVLYDATGDALRRLLFLGITIPLFLGSALFILIRSLIQIGKKDTPAAARAHTSNNEMEAHP